MKVRFMACAVTALVTSSISAALAYSSRPATPSGYALHKLVADTAGVADVTDPNLVNPWGIAFAPGNPFWISDNHSGLSTLYNQAGAIQPLTVTIPPPGGAGTAAPTGVVFNGTGDFGGDLFLFASEDGIISGWHAGNQAVSRVDNSATGAIYKGIALGKSGRQSLLYLANFHDNRIEVYDGQYHPVTFSGGFTDRNEPAGYAPFNVAVIGKRLYVAYAKQDQNAEDDVAGAGNGFIDQFTLTGKFVKRLVSGSAVPHGTVSQLNSPWGMTVAPAHFGKFHKALLVGNFGSGQIAAFNASGKFLGLLTDPQGTPLTIEGLWALTPGGGGASGDPNRIYFTSGPGDEAHGLFGSIAVAH